MEDEETDARSWLIMKLWVVSCSRLLMQAPVINYAENVSLRAPRGVDPTAQPAQSKMGSSTPSAGKSHN